MSLPSTLLRAREDLSENVIHKDNSHKNSMILDTIVARKKEEVAALETDADELDLDSLDDMLASEEETEAEEVRVTVRLWGSF